MALMQAFHTPFSTQQAATPFGNAHTQATGSHSGVMDAVSTESNHVRDNPIQQRARAWAQQRQQEQSVLSQHGSSELQLAPRTRSGLADVAGSSVGSLQQSSSQPGHDTWRPLQTPRGSISVADSSGLGRRQSEPSTSIEDEWPALGIPPRSVHFPFPNIPPLHLPSPTPVHPPQQPPQQAAGAQTPAAFGLQWAANLARGAEWMGEATGLRFLTRPFSRTVAGMTGAAAAASESCDQDPAGQELPDPSSSHSASHDTQARSLHRQSLEQQVSASAPSNGSMSYRERLLAGSKGRCSSTERQDSRQNMVRISLCKQPSQGSQIGFPSQQELDAAHQPSSSSSAAARPSSSPVVALSALSLRGESQASASQSIQQAETISEAPTPAAGQVPLSDSDQVNREHAAPQAAAVLPQTAQVSLVSQYFSKPSE